MGVHAGPALQEFESLHHGLAVPRRDLVAKERGRPDINDDDALARERLRKVDELRDRSVITSAQHVDDGLAPTRDWGRQRAWLVDVQKDRANGGGNGDAPEAHRIA